MSARKSTRKPAKKKAVAKKKAAKKKSPARASKKAAAKKAGGKKAGAKKAVAKNKKKAAARKSACATGASGTRTPKVPSPAVTSPAMPDWGCRGATSVSGPGQKASASRASVSGRSTKSNAPSKSGTWAIRGLKLGRPLASKIPATAWACVASAPSP